MSDLVESFGGLFKGKHYNLFGEGERHGSWEATWGKKDNGDSEFKRYVTIALTPLSETPGVVGYTLELWSGADNGVRYVRRLMSQFAGISEKDFFKPPLCESIRQSLKSVISSTDFLTEGDLTDIRVRESHKMMLQAKG